MSEVYTSPFSTTLTAAYTAGSGTISVAAAAPTAIQNGTFSVALANGTGNTTYTVLKVTGGASTTTWTVTAEYNDSNAASGVAVLGCELSPRVLSALLAQNPTGPSVPISAAVTNYASSGRAFGTAYQNTTGYPIVVEIVSYPNASGNWWGRAFIGASSTPDVIAEGSFTNSNLELGFSFIVPAGYYYGFRWANSGATAWSTSTQGAISGWAETQLQGTSGTAASVSTKTSNYTALSTDYTLLCDASGGAFTITLPSTPYTGQILIIKKIDSSANAVTISGNGKTIDGSSTLSLSSQYQSYRVQFSGVNWYLI